MERWWTEQRLQLYPRAVLAALAAAIVLGAAVSPTPGGDYPCFYAAGQRYGEPASLAVGALASAAVAALVVATWARTAPWAARLGATAAALPLLPPHSVRYDAGLAGIALLVLLVLVERGVAPGIVAAAWELGASAALAQGIGLQPLLPLPVATRRG